jgi:hypothetical protein
VAASCAGGVVRLRSGQGLQTAVIYGIENKIMENCDGRLSNVITENGLHLWRTVKNNIALVLR